MIATSTLTRLTFLALPFGALVVAVAAAPAPVDAEPSPTGVDRFVGSYRYAKSERHGRAVIERAMEPAIEQLDLVTRTIARRKLRRTNTLSHRINISKQGSAVAVEFVGEKTFRFAAPLGVKTKVEAPNGNQVDLTQRIDGDAIVQVFVGPKGTTKNRLILSHGDKNLTYLSVIRGKKLTTPITIRLEYRRL